MSYEENVQKVSAIAAVDLSAKQYSFVKINSAGKMALAADGGEADGVIQDKPIADRVGAMAISGVAKVLCGGAVTAGGNVASDANGAAVDAVSADKILGVAMKGGSAGAIIPVRLKLENATLPD